MAVQAHRLLPTGHASRVAGAGAAAAPAMGDGAPFAPGQACYAAGRGIVAGAGAMGSVGQQQGYGPSSYAAGLVAPPASVAAAGILQFPQFCTPDASESGVTIGGGLPAPAQEVLFGGCPAQEVASRKRRRADQPPVLEGATADVVDRLVLEHVAKTLAAQANERRRQVVAAVEAAAAKRLRVKDEEISRITRLNWALEERLKSLYVEAQVWRELAQSNEAAANAFRGELEHALHTQARCNGGAGGGGEGVGAGGDDAESCCYGENDVPSGNGDGEVASKAEQQQGTGHGGGGTSCRACGTRAAAVLLLPCRHLCTCAPCAGAAKACPACGCAKNGSVCVNFS